MEKKNHTYHFSDAIRNDPNRDREITQFVHEYPFFVIKRNQLFFQKKRKEEV
jgi:hypothetical protein